MLRHPSQHYIYYLLSERKLGVPAIIQLLGDAYLPVPQREVLLGSFITALKAERARMRFPARFDPRDPSAKTLKFLDTWKIRGMWLGDARVERALDILACQPGVKHFLEVMLLGPLQRQVIAQKAREYFGLSDMQLSTGVVRAYEHYFWNRTALTLGQWKDVIYSWLPGRNEEMLQSLTAPNSQAGAALSLHAAGIQASLKAVPLYQTAREQMFKMFMEHSLQDRPSLARTQAACMAIQTVTHVEEQLERLLGGDAELLTHLERIDTQYDETGMTSVGDLPLVPQALPSGEITAPEPVGEET